MVPDVFQPNCVWIMSKQARTAIRKLKDGEGNYLLNKDATTASEMYTGLPNRV